MTIYNAIKSHKRRFIRIAISLELSAQPFSYTYTTLCKRWYSTILKIHLTNSEGITILYLDKNRFIWWNSIGYYGINGID